MNADARNADSRERAASFSCEREGEIAIEGSFLFSRAISRGLEITRVCCVPSRADRTREELRGAGIAAEPEVLPVAELEGVAGYPFHRGVLAFARRPKERESGELLASLAGRARATVAVLPESVDRENLGAAFRNAAAFSCDAVLLGPSGPDPFCRRCVRVSMGATLALPFARLGSGADLGSMRAEGFRVAACVLDPGANDLRRWKRPDRLALVLGNEAFGLSESWLSACDERLTLPMGEAADSLNVATALAVFLYAVGQA